MTFAPGGQNEHNDVATQEASSYNDPLDDVFGSTPSSPTHDSTVEQARRDIQDPSDIPRLRSVHVTNGYREGLAASKEQHVQEGFDEGYSLGAELGMKVGKLLGTLEGIVRALPVEHAAGESERGSTSRAHARGMLAHAEEELSMRPLFGSEFFGGDGVWIYPVPGADEGEEDVTFGKIAAAHPLVLKWERLVDELAESHGLEVR